MVDTMDTVAKISMLYRHMEGLQIYDNVKHFEKSRETLKSKKVIFELYFAAANEGRRDTSQSQGTTSATTAKTKKDILVDECAKKKVCTTAAVPHKTWDIHHFNQPSEVSSQAQHERSRETLKCKKGIFELCYSTSIRIAATNEGPTEKRDTSQSRGTTSAATAKSKEDVMVDECAKKKVCTTVAAPHKTWDIHHSNQPGEVSSQAQHTAKRKLEEELQIYDTVFEKPRETLKSKKFIFELWNSTSIRIAATNEGPTESRGTTSAATANRQQHPVTKKRKLEEGPEEKKRVKVDTLRRWPRHEFIISGGATCDGTVNCVK